MKTELFISFCLHTGSPKPSKLTSIFLSLTLLDLILIAEVSLYIYKRLFFFHWLCLDNNMWRLAFAYLCVILLTFSWSLKQYLPGLEGEVNAVLMSGGDGWFSIVFHLWRVVVFPVSWGSACSISGRAERISYVLIFACINLYKAVACLSCNAFHSSKQRGPIWAAKHFEWSGLNLVRAGCVFCLVMLL